MDLVIDFDAAESRQHLLDMRQRLESSQLLRQAGLLLEQYETDTFRTRGRGQWAPDDPVTVQLKGSSQVLVDTGELLHALTTARIDGESVRVNEGAAYYAKFHRDGERGMPRRDPAPEPSEGQQDEWAESLLAFIVDGRTVG